MTSSFDKFLGWLRWGDPLRFRSDLEALLDFSRIFLNEHGFSWWLEWGTLLGCVRHQALIPWDYDLDVGLTADSLARLRALMPSATLPDGFCYRWYETEGYARFTLRDSWVDLIGYSFEADRGVWCPQLPDYYRNPDLGDECYPDLPDIMVFPLGVGLIKGVEYPVPRNPDAILRSGYGNYRRLDPIPLAFSALYHPLQTARFVREYSLKRDGV